MKKPIIIANWKMKLGHGDTINLAKKIKKGLSLFNKAEVVICPNFTSLSEVNKVLRWSKINLGAQDAFWENSGAFTGEVSAKMLKEIGCRFVIIGHSERREYQRETNADIFKKVKAVLAEDLVPIICVGEKFDERQKGATDHVLIKQVTKAVGGINLKKKNRVVIAYEPIWAISPSKLSIEPSEVEHAHNVIKQTLIDIFPNDIANRNFKIIYGGSVDSKNIKSFMKKDNIEGALVGTASLKAKEFIKIIKLAK